MKTKAYELKVFDSQTAGQVIVALEEIGISNVDLLKTVYSKEEELLIALKSKAIQKAKMNADALVNPLGQKVVRAIHIVDDENRSQFYSTELSDLIVLGYSAKSKSKYTPPEIEFKPINYTSEVRVKFQIQ